MKSRHIQMADIAVNEFFRPWSNSVSGESVSKKNTSDGNGLPLTVLVERGVNSGRLLSASRNKENGATVERHNSANCEKSDSNSDNNLAITGIIRKITGIQSGKHTLPVEDSMASSEKFSRTLPEETASSLDSFQNTGKSPPWSADYLHQSGLYHTLSYPSLSVSSVIWPMEIVPVLPQPAIHNCSQSLYHDRKYSMTIEYAAGMIQSQEEATKLMRKLRPKRFRCEHCDVAFSNNGQLKGHIRIHTGERPFKCDVGGCGKAFTRNEELTRHKRIHTGLRPHTCPICGKCFGRKDHLKKHTRTHENRDLYATSAAALFALGHAPFYPQYVSHI